MSNFDIKKFKQNINKNSRFEKRLNFLNDKKMSTNSIELAVNGAINNILSGSSKSFVIYGEPQSGKTEMMIALTAKLLDSNYKIVILLLNDSVQLLTQNLDRFRRAGLDPSPKNFTEILDKSINIDNSEWVIFCKKNSKDLQKLIDKIGKYNNKVIIDDEADYATPNSKVNKGEKTKINELVGKLINNDGIYIGVTATPARLDLNNTFNNENQSWIDFPPHPNYTGQDIFFPVSFEGINNIKFSLNLLPSDDDSPKFLRDALFSFLINVSYLNSINSIEKNYCMLIHTSGKKADHTEDYKQIVKIFNILKNKEDRKYDGYVKNIWETVELKYPGKGDQITEYIIENSSKNAIIVMNSDVDKKITDYTSATNPSSIFTIAIGGNIISRGVTFDNLLSMFFTRDSKHKIQQDTYIQRARMFGSRGDYLNYFELSIPGGLYLDWQRCFVFHKLSLSAIKTGQGTPIWLEDNRISSVSRASLDKTIINMNSGEMLFEKFNYITQIEDIIEKQISEIAKLKEISEIVTDKRIHPYLIEFIEAFSPSGLDSLVIHRTRSVSKTSDYHDSLDRPKGIFGGEDFKKYPDAIHHIIIIKNTLNEARIVYKYAGSLKTIKKNK